MGGEGKAKDVGRAASGMKALGKGHKGDRRYI
jgi:hypothetical protein